MAKDVVFESEKYMQRQETKRKWLPLIVLAAILLAVIVIALIIRGNQGVTYAGGEDTPYPYSWSVNRKGELNLEISTGEAEGYTWVASNYDIGNLELTRPEKQPAKASSFTVTPDKAGRYVTVFSLVNRGDRNDRLYEWRFLMDSAQVTEGETASAGPLSILSGSGMELAGKQTSGEEDVVSYTLYADADGMTIEIVNPELGKYTPSGSEAIVADRDEGDVVSEEKRGEGDGGKPDETEPQNFEGESIVISDPAEIEELVGMPYDEWVAMVDAEKAESGETALYNYDWTVTSDNVNAVRPAGVFYTGEMAIASLNAGDESGTASVRVSNDALGLEVHAMVENKDGVLSISSYGSSRYEPVVIPETQPEEVPESTEETEETTQP